MPDGSSGSARLSWSVDVEGIGSLLIDPAPGRPPLVGLPLLRDLDAALDASEGMRAVVVRSRTPGAFLAGLDLDEALASGGPAEATELIREGQRVLRRLELLPVPTFAAVRGVCLGAGVELALACSYRLAAGDLRTRIGFPEARFGIVPGLGGTVRLPRLIGLESALDLLLSGRSLSAADAKALGLVDAVLADDSFEAEVASWVRDRLERGRIRTGVRRNVGRRMLEDTAPGRRVVAARAARRLLPAADAPAGRRALDLVLEGVALPLDRAFALEAGVAAELLTGEDTRAMLYAARASARAGRGTGITDPPGPVGLLGAGETGAEWAHRLISAGIPVRIKELTRERLRDGVHRVLRRIALDVRDGGLPETEADRRSGLMEASTGFGGFGRLGAVIVAVGDETDAIRHAIDQAEEHTGDDCLIVVAAPGRTTAELQATAAIPGRILCADLASPPDRFPSLELRPSASTSREAAERVAALGRAAGLSPLVVADRVGGAATRLVGIYLSEGLRLQAAGADPADVDTAMETFGFAMGPFRRSQSIGAARAALMLHRLAVSLGERFLPTERGSGQRPTGPVRTRILLALINEAAAILEEGVVPTPAYVDAAALAALGFPRSRGGILFHADRLGPGAVVESLRELEQEFGSRFAPNPLLSRLAAVGSTFTGQPTAPVL